AEETEGGSDDFITFADTGGTQRDEQSVGAGGKTDRMTSAEVIGARPLETRQRLTEHVTIAVDHTGYRAIDFGTQCRVQRSEVYLWNRINGHAGGGSRAGRRWRAPSR